MSIEYRDLTKEQLIVQLERTTDEVQRWKIIFQESIDGINLTTPQGILEFSNTSVHRMFGYEDGELIGQHVSIFNPVENADISNEEIIPAIQSQGYWRGELKQKRKDGTLFDAYLTTSIIKNSSGDVIGMLGIIRDITEKKQLEQRLLQSQKIEALGTLAGGIAHDFNNILTALMTNAEIALMTLDEEGTTAQDSLDSILNSGERAASLVRQILTFSRSEPTRLAPIDLTTVVTETIEMVRATVPANIDVEKKISNDCPLILGDETQIHQVLLNLCTNAYHALAGERGRIAVHVTTATNLPSEPPAATGAQYVRIDVEDNGVGIPRDMQEKIFDPYFTTKPIGEGTGLGLSVVHGIVEKHQGRIYVDSSLDEGTLFSVFFPVVDIEEFTVAEPEKPHQSGTGGRILFVEDEASVRSSYEIFLTKSGYSVTSCQDGQEAWELFRRVPNGFDLLLTDKALPRLTGLQLAKRVLSKRPDLPIIMQTGYSETVDVETCHALGIGKLLLKPLRLQDVEAAISELLATTPSPSLKITRRLSDHKNKSVGS